jgi:hypothetical protein
MRAANSRCVLWRPQVTIARVEEPPAIHSVIVRGRAGIPSYLRTISEGVHLGQVAIYCSVSTGDQSCGRQDRDSSAFARQERHQFYIERFLPRYFPRLRHSLCALIVNPAHVVSEIGIAC